MMKNNRRGFEDQVEWRETMFRIPERAGIGVEKPELRNLRKMKARMWMGARQGMTGFESKGAVLGCGLGYGTMDQLS